MANTYLFLASEIKELESLLAEIPQENVIERLGLESRLKSAQVALEKLPKEIAQRARLTFRGRPVLGSHGIAADFAGKAAGAFADAFAAVAAGLGENLRYMGPIPNRGKNQLLITGTAVGSFGFEFELPPAFPSLFPEMETSQMAMTKIEALFRLSAEGSDDEVAEIIEEVHPRAVKKVHDFIELLVEQEAWCGLEFADQFFLYSGHEQIKKSHERLKSDNIQERTEAYRGEFQGVLPAGRKFEFFLIDQDGLIRGKVDQAIEDPDILNREWLHKPVTAQFKVMQVGQARPRFTLMSLDDLHI
ncbi:hypothetical protein [Vandammella animalimorsus]|uniref:Uncharacterized protein n=1 Tax=Vandammella animalimorsus TaxID=2029117 RepID=A0A2A2A9V8_9BURK|nr:hypothetical protein [Vandammella animalimorsus]PAT35320.1 hypothetical protein CK620_05430 [Vandammella animalimorsus]